MGIAMRKNTSHLLIYDEVGLDGKPYKKGQWQQIATHDSQMIHGFFGQYRFLSNMWPCSVRFQGHWFPSVENAYQWAKFTEDDLIRFQTFSPKDAKKESRFIPMRHASETWKAYRVVVMRACLISKFSDPSLRQQLLDTIPRHLEETNWWQDRFWGCDAQGIGENRLGRLLMKIRGEIENQS